MTVVSHIGNHEANDCQQSGVGTHSITDEEAHAAEGQRMTLATMLHRWKLGDAQGEISCLRSSPTIAASLILTEILGILEQFAGTSSPTEDKKQRVSERDPSLASSQKCPASTSDIFLRNQWFSWG
jgi:hypothetical protein